MWHNNKKSKSHKKSIDKSFKATYNRHIATKQRKENNMSEKEKQIIKTLADKLPAMSERERGYLEGTIATAAAMSSKKEEQEKNDSEKKVG